MHLVEKTIGWWYSFSETAFLKIRRLLDRSRLNFNKLFSLVPPMSYKIFISCFGCSDSYSQWFLVELVLSQMFRALHNMTLVLAHDWLMRECIHGFRSMTDITNLFKATVKTVKTRTKSDKSVDQSILQTFGCRQRGEFSTKSKSVVRQINCLLPVPQCAASIECHADFCVCLSYR